MDAHLSEKFPPRVCALYFWLLFSQTNTDRLEEKRKCRERELQHINYIWLNWDRFSGVRSTHTIIIFLRPFVDQAPKTAKKLQRKKNIIFKFSQMHLCSIINDLYVFLTAFMVRTHWPSLVSACIDDAHAHTKWVVRFFVYFWDEQANRIWNRIEFRISLVIRTKIVIIGVYASVLFPATLGHGRCVCAFWRVDAVWQHNANAM